jgi:flagellin
MLRIASNLASISAQRALGLTQRSVEKSMRALASGSRFTDAGADASGQAIAEQLRGQIKGYEAARYNSDNAVSFVQLAEGAINEQSNILIRLRELAVQAASDTLGDKEREFLDYEVKGLTQEFDRIAKATKFGSQPLLDGTTKAYEFQVGVHKGSENVITYNHNANTTASHLDIDGMSVADKGDARDSLSTIDDALVELNGSRARLGAIQSRMESATSHIDTQIENLTDAHSRMSDADIPAEVSNMRRGQILQQYQASVLAQANDSNGYLLKLIA